VEEGGKHKQQGRVTLYLPFVCNHQQKIQLKLKERKPFHNLIMLTLEFKK